MNRKRRKLEVVSVSDVHLGTFGSQAKELNRYLQSIKPEVLVLNGDIIDFWQFSKRYWPKPHMKVLKSILNLASKGTQVFYITGNHDETLRKFSGMRMGNIEIVNKLELDLMGIKTWFFHGDVFDVIMQNSRWLAKFGAIGYDSLVLVNVFINFLSKLLGRKKVSLSKRIKESVKSAVKYIGYFEITAVSLAMQKGYQAIVCGHIHHPEIKEIFIPGKGKIMYLNSGDWIENLTALEYNNGTWSLYRHQRDESTDSEQTGNEEPGSELMDMGPKDIFDKMVKEFRE